MPALKTLTVLALFVALASAAPARPLILVPGWLGSSLNSIDADGKSTTAWVRLDGSDVYLGGEYNSATGNFENLLEGTTTVTKPGGPGNLGAISGLARGFRPYFKNMIKSLEKNLGYTAGEDLWAFPYDWRQAISSHADDFAALVSELAGKSDDGKVDVVAHSMGTLVTKYAIGTNEDVASKINGWIVLGGPLNGVGQALGHPLVAWLSGPNGYVFYPFSDIGKPAALEGYEVTSVSYELNGETVVVENDDAVWPDFVEEVYKDFVYTYKDGTKQPSPWRRDIYEALDQEKAVLWFDLPESAAHVKVYNMIGDLGPDSTYLAADYGAINELTDLITKSPVAGKFQRGDGTVPLWSAQAEGAIGAVTREVVPFSHGDLVEGSECIAKVVGWVAELAE